MSVRTLEHAILIGAANCRVVTGLSWPTARRVARAHDVPIYQVSPRKHLIPAALLLAALKQHHAASTADESDITEAQACAKLLRVLG